MVLRGGAFSIERSAPVSGQAVAARDTQVIGTWYLADKEPGILGAGCTSLICPSQIEITGVDATFMWRY